MKKQIISILSAAMLMQGLPTVSSAETVNTETEWWEGKTNINISFIGGSNTVSHHPNGWVQKTAENIKEKTGVEKVTVNNAGYGGTGSNFGVYRLENDVIKTDPDIVFIEFAGNDVNLGVLERNADLIGDKNPKIGQHTGFGEKLLREAENLAIDNGKEEMAIISGIGSRNYYRKFGYEKIGPYMKKEII